MKKTVTLQKAFMLICVVASLGFQAFAEWYTLPAGSEFNLYISKANSTNNPNNYHIAVFGNNGNTFAFLLDGSEQAKGWYSLLQDALNNNKTVQVAFDPSNAAELVAQTGPSGSVFFSRSIYTIVVTR